MVLNSFFPLPFLQNLFRAVLPFHCLGCIWSQRDKKKNQHMAPSVRATVIQFNAVTSCVITSVLGDLAMHIPQRANLLEKWIQIAGVSQEEGQSGGNVKTKQG